MRMFFVVSISYHEQAAKSISISCWIGAKNQDRCGKGKNVCAQAVCRIFEKKIYFMEILSKFIVFLCMIGYNKQELDHNNYMA